MNFDWTAEVVGRMHMAAITGKQLADEAGLTNSYLSAVLHNKKGNASMDQLRYFCRTALRNELKWIV